MGTLEELSKFNQLTMIWAWITFICSASTVLIAIWCTVWSSYRKKKKSSVENLSESSRTVVERSPILRRDIKLSLDPSANIDLPGTEWYPQDESLFKDIQLASDLNSIENVIGSCDSPKNILKTDTREDNEVLQEKEVIAQSNKNSISASDSEDLINTATSKEYLRMYAYNGVVHDNKNMADKKASSAPRSIVNGHSSEDSITDVAREKHQNMNGLNDVFVGNKDTIRRIGSSLSSSSVIKEHRLNEPINNDAYEGHRMIHSNDNILREIKSTLKRKASDLISRYLRDKISSEDLQTPLDNDNIIDSNERFFNVQKSATDVNNVHLIVSGSGDSLKNQNKTVSNIIDHQKRSKAEITANAKDVFGFQPATDVISLQLETDIIGIQPATDVIDIQPASDVLQVLQENETKSSMPTTMHRRNASGCKKCDMVDFISLYAPEIKKKLKDAKRKKSKKGNRKK